MKPTSSLNSSISVRTTEFSASLYQLIAVPMTFARPWFSVVVTYWPGPFGFTAEMPLIVGTGTCWNVR